MNNPRSEIYTAILTALSHDGRGIANVDGKVTFIEGALPNEEVKFKITKTRGKFNEAQVVEIIKPSADRVQPQCEHFATCGGCALQHLSHNAQIDHKQNYLLQQLKYIAHSEPHEILAPLFHHPWEYRNKARLGVKFVSKKSTVLVGFHEKNSRYLADINSCEILHPSVGKKITELRILLGNLDGHLAIPQIEVSISDTTSSLVIRHTQKLKTEDLEQLKNFAKTHDFRIYLQPAGPESIHSLWPENTENLLLNYQLDDYDLQLQFHPSDFTQINNNMNKQLVKQAMQLLDPQKNDVVLDLFCGLGNFTLPLAKYTKYVVGVEGSQAMVDRAKQNARMNQITNVEFHMSDLNQDLIHKSWFKEHYNKILLDPPRSGALEAVKQLAKYNYERIVYISCNPATLARDAHELIQQGYEIKKAGIIDMFPQTYHVESIALFEKTA